MDKSQFDAAVQAEIETARRLGTIMRNQWCERCVADMGLMSDNAFVKAHRHCDRMECCSGCNACYWEAYAEAMGLKHDD